MTITTAYTSAGAAAVSVVDAIVIIVCVVIIILGSTSSILLRRPVWPLNIYQFVVSFLSLFTNANPYSFLLTHGET